MPDPLPPDLPDPHALSERALSRMRECGGSPEDVGRFLDTIPEMYADESGANEVLRWEITDEGAAEWALRMYAAALARAREIKRQADAWRASIDQWEQDQSRPVDADLSFFGDHLTQWAQARRQADPDMATIRLPSGTVATTLHRKPKFTVTDKAAFLAWCQENASAVVHAKPVEFHVPADEIPNLGRVAYDGVTNLLVTDDGAQVPYVSVEVDRVLVKIRPNTDDTPNRDEGADGE